MNADFDQDPTLEERAPRVRVGRLLRRQREAYNQDLHAVADATRIRYAYLHAIEEGRFADLPGITYAVGFVRTYADYLGLDEEEIVSRFKEEVEGLERRTNLEFPVPVSEGKVPSGAIIALAVILVAIAYGGWYYLSERNQNLSDLVPEVPERLQNLLAEGETANGGNGDSSPGAAQPAEPAGKDMADEATAETATSEQPAESMTDRDAQPEAEQQPAAGVEDTAEGGLAAEPEQAMAPQSDIAGVTEPAADIAERATQSTAMDGEGLQPVSEATPEGDGGTALEDTGVAEDGRPATAEAAAQSPTPGASETAAEASTAEAATDASTMADEGAGRTSATAGTETAAQQSAESATQESTAPAIPSAPQSTQEATTGIEGEGRVFGAANRDARIVLRATGDSWVQVRDAEGQLLLTRVLREGDVYRVPNRDGLTLLTGNAGGLVVTVDDQSAPALGDDGEVIRDIPLDPQRLLDGTAVPQ